MNQIKVIKIAAFTQENQGGNSAGLVWPATGINASERQKIAAAVGYSETAFVEKVANNDLRFEYFTPNRQIDICGHATVAAFSFLRDSGEISLGQHSFESVVGKHKAEVREKTVGLWQKQLNQMELKDPKFLAMLLKSLDLNPSDLLTPLIIASNGAPFLLIEVRDLSTLKNINPNQKQILELSQQLNLVGYYVYFRANEKEFDTRMFAPAYGIAEESATGMAAGALALSLSIKSKDNQYIFRQGHLMSEPSPSLLYADVFDDNRVLISGETVAQASGLL